MPKQNKDTKKYHCRYCNLPFDILPVCVAHEEGHRKLFVPLTKEEIQRILMFFYQKDDTILADNVGQGLVKTLRQYLRAKEL